MKQKLCIFMAILSLTLSACSQMKTVEKVNEEIDTQTSAKATVDPDNPVMRQDEKNSSINKLNTSITNSPTPNNTPTQTSTVNTKTNTSDETKVNVKIVHSTLNYRTFTELVDIADLIVEVEIIKFINEENEPTERTYFEAKICKDFKYPDKQTYNNIIIKQQGNSKAIYDGIYLFQPKDRLILFLKSYSDGTGRYWILGEHSGMYCVKSLEQKDYIYKRVGDAIELTDIEDKSANEKIQKDLEKTKKKYEDIDIMQSYEKDKFYQKLAELINKNKK